MRALLLDAAGTLLHPRQPVVEMYRVDAGAVREAMVALKPLRARDRGWRAYWQAVVQRATGDADPALFERLYRHYAGADAWFVAPGAEALCRELRGRGIKIAVVSNWDDRLRPLLRDLGVLAWVDLAVVSAEEGVEKPDARIFALTCERLSVDPSEATMVGDTFSADVQGARGAGLHAVHFGHDVADFAQLAATLA